LNNHLKLVAERLSGLCSCSLGGGGVLLLSMVVLLAHGLELLGMEGVLKRMRG
jgi:hypothetical protein